MQTISSVLIAVYTTTRATIQAMFHRFFLTQLEQLYILYFIPQI